MQNGYFKKNFSQIELMHREVLLTRKASPRSLYMLSLCMHNGLKSFILGFLTFYFYTEGQEISEGMVFSNFSCMFLNPNIFFQLDMRNLQEQVKNAFCYQKLFWPFTVWINCSSDLKKFANSQPSASNFKKISWSLEQFFLTVCQNNFGNKIPFLFAKYPSRSLGDNICKCKHFLGTLRNSFIHKFTLVFVH